MDSSTITSMQNERVKHLLSLQQKSAVRRREGLFVVEGLREVTHCIRNNYPLHSLFYCPTILSLTDEISRLLALCPTFALSERVYEKVAYRGTTEGIVAIVESKSLELNDLRLCEHPLILVLEGIEKPGNVGAILRTADACKADAVVVCDSLTDLYNPNLIRSSLGAVFTVPCICCSTAACIAFLRERKIQIITAQLQDSVPYYSTDLRCGTAIVLGSEAAGLTEAWRQAADARIHIPMLGQVDSLNVSTSAAILAYEAIRQRLSI